MSFAASALAVLQAATPADIVGGCAVALGCSWPLYRSRGRILGVQCIGAMLFGVHYILLGAPTGAAVALAAAVQAVAAAMLREGWMKRGVFALTVLAGLIVTVTNFAGLPSLFAQGGAFVTTAGRLQRSAQAMRWFFLAASAFWVTHNLLVGSVWGLTADSLSVSMLAVGIWRERAPRAAQSAPARPATARPAAARPASALPAAAMQGAALA